MDNVNELKALLRKGITTSELIEATGDKKAVIKAFDLGAKIECFKKDAEGIERGFLKLYTCIKCNEPFTNENVHSSEGLAETKISQICEDCFDDIFIGEMFSGGSMPCDICGDTICQCQNDKVKFVSMSKEDFYSISPDKLTSDPRDFDDQDDYLQPEPPAF
jgi:hypothetical protein